MKALGFLSTTALLGVGALNGQAVRDAVLPNPVRVSTRVQMLASVEQVSAKLGDPVRVHVHCKNVSSKVVALGDSSWERDYSLTVTDASGAEPPRTTLGDDWLRMQKFGVLLHGSAPILLKPGEEDEEFVINVAKIYRLTRPGTYFVRVMFRTLVPEPGEARPASVEEAQKTPIEEGVSNLVQFTIIP